ncbi:hypothetical protein BHE74_00030968 [Ensete ventricosum]|nr:hypothetical protein BHE74_00030968 [Ensete ventricosum]
MEEHRYYDDYVYGPHPPGIRFTPKDEQLIVYLTLKCSYSRPDTGKVGTPHLQTHTSLQVQQAWWEGTAVCHQQAHFLLSCHSRCPLLFNRLPHITPKQLLPLSCFLVFQHSCCCSALPPGNEPVAVVSRCFPTVASSSSNSIKNKESLKASAVVCELPDAIKAEIHDLLTDGVVAYKVVRSIFLATD